MPIVKGFRRFHSNTVSTRQVVTKISSVVSGPNVEQSERSSAAPIASNRPIRKRVNSADRRQMLESFVNNYRAMNLGKFPSPTSAQKEVGGSYYLIKKMLQEMEYNSKKSPAEKSFAKENKKQIKGDGVRSQKIAMESSGSQEKSNSRKAVDRNLCEDSSLESGSIFDNKTDSGNSNNPSDDTQNIATESYEKPERNPRDDTFAFKDTESKVSEQPHNIATEIDEKTEQNPRDDNFAFKDTESKVEKQPDRIRNTPREEEGKDNQLREKASLWGNLKSLANEFINMWKK